MREYGGDKNYMSWSSNFG